MEQIDCIDRSCDEGDCIWLSSESATPSLFDSDDSQDLWELDCLELTLGNRFCSMLSLSSSFTASLDEDVGTSFSDSSTAISPNQASLFLNKLHEDAEHKLLHKHVTQPQETIGYNLKDSAVNYSESGSYSSFGWPHSVKSPVCGNRCTSLYGHTSTSSESDRSYILISSLDISREDFNLPHGKEPGIGIFGSNMLSPSISRQVNKIKPLVSSYIISTVEDGNVNVSAKDYDSGEPLFWPFDYTSYTCLDSSGFLCLSPPKERKLVDISGFHGSNSFTKRSRSTGKTIQVLKRIATLSSKSKTATCVAERIGLRYATQKKDMMSPGLSQSRNHPRNQPISKRRQLPQLNVNVPRHKSPSSNLLVQSSEGLELYDFIIEGVSIAKVVGLTEFIGQERINSDFEGDFDLCGSLLHELNAI